MRRITKAVMAVILASLIFYNAHKPQDHEEVAESPTGTETIPSAVPPQNREAQPTGEDTVKVEIAEPTPKTQLYEATFYTAGCDGCTGITATGIDVRNTIYHEGRRIIAVDPNVIPLGSTVTVTLANGDSFEATAQDVGGAIKGNRIDVLVASRNEAYRLGRQSAKVEVIN